MGAIRGERSLEEPFIALSVSILALAFYPAFFSGLEALGTALAQRLEGIGGEKNLKEFVLQALKQAAAAPPSLGGGPTYGLNLPSLGAQVWNLGVWGALTLVVQWVFLLARLLLISAHAILSKLLYVSFPIACSFYPVRPGILGGQIQYAVELTLWLPTLFLLEGVTSTVARSLVTKTDDLGLYLTAVELVSVVLILGIPGLTHRFMSGALQGDHGSVGGVVSHGKRMLLGLRGVLR